MKTQIVRTLAIFSFLVCGMAIYASTTASGNDKVIGTWQYSAPDAPYGYQDGTFEFKEADGKLVAIAVVGDTAYEIKTIRKEGDTYSFNLFVDGVDVDFIIKSGDNGLTGKAEGDGWELPITFKPAKK